MVRVADYIAQSLTEHGIRDVFLVTGGAAMHLNDALGHTDGLNYTVCRHEQACAIAAEGYFRASGRMAAVNVTSGPGGTNALTGVAGQWLDSIPALYLSGQVKRETTMWANPGLGLRQLGDQELPIIDVVRPITKFAAMVVEPRDIRKLLEKAIHVARSGRPGPVWLDIPLDVQSAHVDAASLEPWVPTGPLGLAGAALDAAADAALEELAVCTRPVLLAGFGVRLAGGQEALLRVAETLGIPLLASMNGTDLVPTDHPLFAGRPGTVGSRAGNFVVQNADLLLSVGARNNIRQVSYQWRAFARHARKVIVDIDAAELAKPTVHPDLGIHADARLFLEAIERRAEFFRLPDWSEWRAWCAERRRRYFGARPEEGNGANASGIDPYLFVEALTRALPENATLVSGNGTAFFAPFQVGIVRSGQRFIWNDGCASMGYDLPAALGAAISRPGERIVCLAGDGSVQMNIQELQTVAHLQLPITILVLNNGGYVSMRQTQDSYFGGQYVGCSQSSGMSCPDFVQVAGAYGLPAMRIEGPDFNEALSRALAQPAPLVVEIMLDHGHTFHPKLSSVSLPDGRLVSKPLEDLSPLLPRDEFVANMIVPRWPED